MVNPLNIPVSIPVLEVEGAAESQNTEYSPVVKRVAAILGSLTLGAGFGYFGYGLACLANRIEKGAVIQPTPYVLSGFLSASIVETARLAHDAAHYTLGEREKYEHLIHPNESSTFDHLRQKTWKIIACVEGLHKKVDTLYSNLFNIRTAEQIRIECPTDQDYYKKSVFKLMEAVRRAFWEQVEETMKTSVPQGLSLYTVEAMGYTIIGGHLFTQMLGLMFVVGFINKTGAIFEKFEDEKLRVRENKRTCDLLAALYPYETAKMEAALANSESFESEKIEEEAIDLTEIDHVSVSDDGFSSDEEDELSVFSDDSNLHAREVQLAFIRQQLEFYEFDSPSVFMDSVLPSRICNFNNVFDYCRSTHPIKGFPLPVPLFDNKGNEIESDDGEVIEIENEKLPENFVLVGLEEAM